MSPLQACVQDSAGSSRPFLSLALTAGQSFLGMHCLTCISGGPSGWGGVGRIQWKESSGSQSRSSQPQPHRRMTLGFQSQTPLFPGSREQRWWPRNRPWRERGRVNGAEVSPGLCDSRAATACCLMGGNQPIPPIGWTWEGRKTSPKLPFLPPLLSIQQHPWPIAFHTLFLAALGPYSLRGQDLGSPTVLKPLCLVQGPAHRTSAHQREREKPGGNCER